MKRFSELRVRFAKTLCRLAEYGSEEEKSPRPLKIASVLLMDSASDSLDELTSEIYKQFKSAATDTLTEIKKNVNDVPTYVRFLNSMGAISTSVVSFLQMTDRSADDTESKLLVQFVKSLSNALQKVVDISDSVNLRQGNNIYNVFEHIKIRESAEEMLTNLERNKVVDLLIEKGAKGVASKIDKSKKLIEIQIRNAERLSKMKERQGTPILDEDKDVDFVSGAA